MKRLLALIVITLIGVNVYAQDITIKGIPDEISQEKILEWVSVLIERNENQKLQPPKDKVEAAETLIDNFREANGLEKKYSVTPVEL